ncbi:MAG: hypothetical protein H0W83_00590 [Planctomycetes bacterium]|nr:hypothetical protein [Planctomycetota bacterium]
MIVVENRFSVFNALQAWYPDDPHEVEALLARAPVVTAMQCETSVADALDRFAFRRRPFHTSLVDLRTDEETLWGRLEKKTCRYQINKARKLAPEVMLNEHLDVARTLIHDFITRHRFRAPLGDKEWERIVACCDVFVAKHQGKPMVAHVILADTPHRVRALMSATADRADPAERGVVGALNRWLHWHEFCHYRTAGVATYDLGGIVTDPNLPEYSITQFKSLFGGTDVTHQVLHLARNPLLRAALRAVSNRRSRLKAQPSPARSADHPTDQPAMAVPPAQPHAV